MGSWLPEYYFHNFWDVIYQKVFNDISSRGARSQIFFVCLFNYRVCSSGPEKKFFSKCWAVLGNIIN